MTAKKQDKTKIVQIWGDILDQGFTSVPNTLLRYRTKLGIKSHHLSLIIDIMSFKWDIENPFPSYSALAEKAGVTERGIMKTIQDLEKIKLLIRTQRFDKETGAQITTVFDFRPLVQKLTDETRQSQPENEPDIEERHIDHLKGGELKITGGMNYSSGGGVNHSSPKEYTYNNKTQINKKTLNVQNKLEQKTQENSQKKNKNEGVHKYFRNGIFRKRLFEIYDNLSDIKPIEELVEQGAQRACKEIVINRANHIFKNNIKINPDQIAEEVSLEFPYNKIPNHIKDARRFFVATVCNITAEKISTYIENK